MPKLEYHTEVVVGDDEAINAKLNALGFDAWELIATVPIDSRHPEAGWRCFFMRQAGLDQSDHEFLQQVTNAAMGTLPPEVLQTMRDFQASKATYLPHG